MLRAEEVMNRNIITVEKDTPIIQAMETMMENEISGVPVVDDNMKLVGILSDTDVVSLAYHILYESGDLENRKVRHFMTERVVSFDKDDNLFDVCDFLAKNLFRRVPVTSGGRIVGIISIPDLIEYLLKFNQEKQAAASKTK
jgi:signal-transduction protein with cAMP-binding, CBS, and nucleotidyltransferase domain